MLKLLIITERPLHNAPRVLREIEALKNDFSVHTIGISEPIISVKSHIPFENIKNTIFVRGTLLLKRKFFKNHTPNKLVYRKKLKKIESIIQELKPELVILHEPINLPYLCELKSKYQFKLVLNAHEYHPLEYEDRPKWGKTMQPFYENLYRVYLPQVDLFINVCESIRQKCIELCGKDSIIIPNASAYNPIVPKTTSSNPIKIIHHGLAISSRKIEEMIKMASILGKGYELHLMIAPADPIYYNHIVEIAKKEQNVFIKDTVPFKEIVPTINQYDIGLFLLPPTNFNYSIALPNKFFEFLQAKLCIAIGPSPEMKYLLEKYELGVVSDNFTPESLAKLIASLSFKQINRYKQNAVVAAKELGAESYNQLLLKSILKFF